MKPANMKQEQNEIMIPENEDEDFIQADNEPHKPFLATTIHKTVPIGYEYHQVQVPDFIPPSPSIPRQQLPPPQSPPVFLRSKVQEEELEQYLSFVESYYEQKIPDFFSQGSVSRDRTRTKAMQFLHEMGYNYVRAKFYILFPYYLTYNQFRCHQPLNLSDAEMTRRITDHLQGLKSTKQKQLERWIGTVENSIQSRIHLSKLNTLIEVAKQNKYEIPEAIREHVQKSIKTGRQIKKALHSTRLTLDKLILKRDSLQQCKIITNQMIQFQETVGRCEDWLKKQSKFQETFFTNEPEPKLLPITEKIEFRTLQLLVNQFNNLPLIYDNFDKTTGLLYNNTINLLQKLPPLNKPAKTRTAQSNTGSIKISVEAIRECLKQIEVCPVEHEDFASFQSSVSESLEWLQRIGMWLQDQKAQKSLKVLNQYSKIISDIPITNKIQQKLQSRLQYYQIMQKVKKDISNPAKYEQIKEAIKKLKQKGYETCQYAKIQTRIISYMGWYESQQILNEDRLPNNNLDFLLRKKVILQRMIQEQAFKSQLLSARQELNIPEEVWIQSEGKVRTSEALKAQILSINHQEDSNINEILDVVRLCIKNGLIFSQFQTLYDKLMEIFFILGQMSFLLLSNSELQPDGPKQFFSTQDVQVIMTVLYQNRDPKQLQQLQTKQAGDQILSRANIKGFPKHLPQYQLFQQFMQKSAAWNEKALRLISAFKQQAGDVNIRQLIEESKSCLHSKGIEQELSKIDIVLKWRQKINRKLSDHRESPFDEKDRSFISEMQKDLQQFEGLQQGPEKMKFRALQYLWQNGNKITKILEKISTIQIDCTYKLSQMNKFCKQIDRQIQKYKLQDKIIMSLKDQLQQQLLLSDEWKEKYLSIKRFEKKKMRKEDEDLKEVDIEIDIEDNKNSNQNMAQEGVYLIPYVPHLLNLPTQGKRKYYIRNGEFCWYFKLLLMIFEFYNGYSLKFSIDDQVRLKGLLSDIYKFIMHYNSIMSKQDKTDSQLVALQAEGAKIPIFFREIFVLSKKNAYINTWKELTEAVLKSVPIMGMQLKARKPEELLELLEMKKQQKDQGKDQGKGEQLGNKRKRKQNTFYSNQDMTLITEDTFGIKTKKKRKGNNPDQQYRNTAVASTAKKLARSQRQDFQRAEALLSGEVPAQLIQIDDPKEYCICRYGVPNENTIMIQCEYKCTQWYHIECLGIKKHQTKSDVKWRCVGCKALYKEDSQGYFFWDSHAKITEYALIELVEEGRSLGVETHELEKLEILYSKINEWKASVKDMLRKVCETNGQDLPALEPALYELFLQSLWLPTAHPEAAILRKLVLVARNEL